MRRRITVALASAFIAVAVVAGAPSGSAQTEPTPTPPKAKAGTKHRNGCSRLFSQYQFRKYAKRVYRRPKVQYPARRWMRQMVRCQHSPKAERKMRTYRKAQVGARHARRELDSLTPYGAWAIPTYIVMCESGGSWTAYNPSGARGPYQFLGWRVPWPVRSAADKIAHHRMAAKLWAGGRGRSHWVCA